MKLANANLLPEKNRLLGGSPLYLYDNGFSQLGIDGVSPVLDGDCASALAVSDHRDRLPYITAQRKQECIQLLIVGLDPEDNILFTFFSLC